LKNSGSFDQQLGRRIPNYYCIGRYERAPSPNSCLEQSWQKMPTSRPPIAKPSYHSGSAMKACQRSCSFVHGRRHSRQRSGFAAELGGLSA
jgi:hypothetical protein